MTHATMLLQWHYLIFVLPMGVAALLLLLSSLRLGHHGGHGSHGGHSSHGPATHGHTAPRMGAHGSGARAHSTHSHGDARHTGGAKGTHSSGQKTGEAQKANDSRPNVTVTNHFVLNLTGANRAPLALILEAFLLIWGASGLLVHQMMGNAETPSPRQIALLIGVALGVGLVGARIAAAVIGRVMPQDETLIVSRQELIGLTGTIVFPAGATSGRIHVYDSFGTLHDEMCRVTAGHPAIAKGRTAMVLDMDAEGRLLVEELV